MFDYNDQRLKDLYCPFWRKSMAKSCPTCPMWVKIRGKNSNTGEDIDGFNCAIAWGPMLLIENSQKQRETGAAIESFRNVVAAAQVPPVPEAALMRDLAQAHGQLRNASEKIPYQISQGDGHDSG